MKRSVAILLLSVATTAQAQVTVQGLILDLDADKGIEVEDGDRVIKWTNQVTTFPAGDFVKQDQGRKEPGSGRPTLKKSVAAIGGHDTLVFRRHWGYEDPVYRFYHQSFKVYHLQADTAAIVKALQNLAPHLPLNPWFTQIVDEGTAGEFSMEVNQRWVAATRPILEAFFHARYFLEMVCKYGKELSEPPDSLPSGWAAVLYLYGLR